MYSWAAKCQGVGPFINMQSSVTSSTITNNSDEESSFKLSYLAAPMPLRGNKDYNQGKEGCGRDNTNNDGVTYTVNRGIPGNTSSPSLSNNVQTFFL